MTIQHLDPWPIWRLIQSMSFFFCKEILFLDWPRIPNWLMATVKPHPMIWFHVSSKVLIEFVSNNLGDDLNCLNCLWNVKVPQDSLCQFRGWFRCQKQLLNWWWIQMWIQLKSCIWPSLLLCIIVHHEKN